MRVPFFKLDSSDREIELVTEVIKSGWLTTASKAVEFEKRFTEICQAKHALSVNSCTAGLHLALEALGIEPGDKVIVPSLTFTASAEVIRYLGAHPVFIDCDFETGLVTTENIAKAFSRQTDIKACIVVHFAGQSAKMDGDNGIATFCKKNNIKLVVDAAHAFPSSDSYGPVGSIGDITCFSFYANKTITTGEGGMIVTNDDVLAARMKIMRLHGINRDVWDRFTSKSASWEYDIVAPGFKYNMPDVNAAIGLAQLERSEEFRLKRQLIAEMYTKAFGHIENLTLLKCRVKLQDHSWHLFPIILTSKAGLNRDQLIEKLNEDGIGTSVHYKPLHLMTYYKNNYKLQSSDFPQTEKIWKRCLSLPIYPAMTDEQIRYVISRVLFHCDR